VDGLPLHLPAAQHYECIQCGRSCGEFWEIRVEPEIAASIRARPADALAEASDPRESIAPSRFDAGRETMRLVDGHCCMLTAGGLCALHKAFGEASKPNVCRSFPYRFIETPRGVHTGVSFACTATLGNLGPHVADQAEAVRATHAMTVYRQRIETPPPLAVDIPLDWDQYFAIEEDLDELLALPGVPIEERLVGQSVYLTLLSRFLRQKRGSAGDLTGEADAHGEAFARFRRQMRDGGDIPWAVVRRIAGRRRRSELLRRVCLGTAHELRNVYGRQRGRWASYAGLARTYIGMAWGRGAIALPRLGGPVEYRRMRAVRFDPSAPAMDELLTRYFRHRIERKDLLGADDLQFGLQLQLLHWGLIHWYAAATAADAGRDAIALDDLRDGLRDVEKYFVLHAPMDRLFADYPMLRIFVDRLFGRPLFAFSMARGEWGD
jgi:Fe-S-cluster containining protein